MKAFLGKLPVAAKALLLVLGTVAAVLGILTFAEYRPADRKTLIEDHEVEKVLEAGVPMTLVSLNCGYGALGDNADFFMDGGTSVRTASRERVERNLAGMLEFLQGLGARLRALGVGIGFQRLGIRLLHGLERMLLVLHEGFQ